MQQPSKPYDLIIFIGRMQPIHNGHTETINHAFTLSDRVAVLFGSANKPCSAKNPFTVEDRELMLRSLYPDEDTLYVGSLPDTLYKDHLWVEAVNEEAEYARVWFDLPDDAKIALIGFYKDRSSEYQAMFPNWGRIEMEPVEVLNATDIRKTLFEVENTEHKWSELGKKVAPETVEFLKGYLTTQEAYRVCLEHWEIKKSIEEMAKYKYAVPGKGINTVAVDPVVFHPSGRILMVRRGGRVGHALLALPGGYLEVGERLLDGCIRELLEETKLCLAPVSWNDGADDIVKSITEVELKRAFKVAQVFDHPDRSQVGRIISHAHLFVLDTPFLPPVKGSDDAKEAVWVKVADLPGLVSQIFDDHADIIEQMLRFV